MSAISELRTQGMTTRAACESLSVPPATYYRRRRPASRSLSLRPRPTPARALSATERQGVLEVLHSERFVDKSPAQVWATLLDEEGTYLCSPRTMYRILADAKEVRERRNQRRAPTYEKPELVATGPNQVWSWDITYLRGPVRGTFFYLYLFVDIWSRKIVGAEVYEEECNEKAARLFRKICRDEGLDPDKLVLHSDNGGPMKGSTMQATLEQLGVIPSLSRPRVSNDNPFSESLFRTLKFRPGYPEGPFESLGEARLWIRSFLGWYNKEHLHSGIGFVTPESRHSGRDRRILEKRRVVYQQACRDRPERFAGGIRQWKRPETVYLNPEQESLQQNLEAA